MRKTVVALAFFMGVAGPAHAQIPVTDGASLAQQLKSFLQEVKAYGTQLQQLQQEVQQVQWAANTFAAFVQNPNLGTAMGVMNMAGLTQTLPVNPYAVQSLVSGYGGISSKLGAISGLANSSFMANSTYQCQDQSWACQQAKANATGTAGAQGIAMAAMQQITAHMPVLTALRARLAAASTPKEVQDVQAAIATEHAWAANQANELAAAQMMVAAQRDANEQRQNERLNQSIDSVLASAPGG